MPFLESITAQFIFTKQCHSKNTNLHRCRVLMVLQQIVKQNVVRDMTRLCSINLMFSY
uniref:Uncharacterized protein n=1 Tax=Arundo donax TaxID=35708 RepID=A0A0A9C048_ARUDO